MREIKFRGNDGMGWIYGMSIDYDKETDTYYMFLTDIFEWIMVGDVSQFTGLTDKNGEEIYEGDILKPVRSSKLNGVHAVVWYNNGFMIEYKFMSKFQGTKYEDKNYLPIYPDSYKVIGNIYENKELLNTVE